MLYHLLLQASYHRLYLKLFYAYLPCTSRVSYSRTTFPLCMLCYSQTSKPHSHQKSGFQQLHTFCTFAALIFHLFLSIFLYTYIFATNSVLIFPPSSSFIMPITFLFFPIGSGLLSSVEYSLITNFVSTYLLQCLCKNLVSLYVYSIAYYHTWTACSHGETHTLASCLRSNIACPRYTGLFIFISVFPISTGNKSFENGYPSLNFGFITYLVYFSRLVTSFMSEEWFLIFSMVFRKTLLFMS